VAPEDSSATLEFYIKYKYLSGGDLGILLRRCNRLFSQVHRMYFSAGSDFEPVLLVDEILTGQSVRLKLIGGWRPRVSTEEGELVVGVNRSLGLPLLTLVLLMSAADKAIDFRNKYYEGELQKMDMVLKQYEIDKARAEGLAPLKKEGDRIVTSLLKNRAITDVEINGVPIKGSSKRRSTVFNPRHGNPAVQEPSHDASELPIDFPDPWNKPNE
jgi:hypothetical protein